MSEWHLEVSHEAEKALLRQNQHLRLRLRNAVDRLQSDPMPSSGYDIQPVKGHPGMWRLRVGDWRILYTVDENTHVIYIVAVHPRGQAYRGL